MRLKQIKLAGFKSFVEPTQVPFPTAMTCVVGPNGCGKSNVIDAVRWVLGESSAKNLRGDAMTDVIFNGSAQRKPVSQASVELVFENTEGRLQGSLADRSEIAVKRVVTRDAQSLYFLNGSKCRRRDITDIFLGTGLGPRSYAIIEQGMISRLIESRPQELRVFIEEAAGISKYKERRRETENRMTHTRDNLDRLADVREELGKNLDKLRRQAATAERYKELKATERRLKAELTALRWYHFNQQLQQSESALGALETEYQQFMADGSGALRQLESLKQQQQQQRDTLTATQQQYYQLGSQISALEQQQLHQRSRAQEIHEEKRRLQQELDIGLDTQQRDEAQLAELQAMLLELAPELELAEQQYEEAQHALAQAEQQGEQDTAQLQQRQQQQFRLSQQISQLELSEQHLQSQISRAAQKTAQLQQHMEALAQSPLAADLAELATALTTTELALSAQTTAVVASQQTLAQSRETAQALQLAIHRLELEQQTLEKQLARLAQQISAQLAAEPLLPKLTITPGWDIAVSVALQALSHSRQTFDFSALAGHLLAPLPVAGVEKPARWSAYQSLAEQVKAKAAGEPALVPAFFRQIYCVKDFTAALALQSSLQDGESVMCPAGNWLGVNWLIRPDEAALHNPMQLAQQQAELQQQQQELAVALIAEQDALARCQAQIEAAEISQRELQTAQQQQAQQLQQQQALQGQWQYQFAQQQQQQQQLQDEISQLDVEVAQWLAQMSEQQQQLVTLREAQCDQLQQQDQLEQQQQQQQAELRQWRAQAQQLNQQLQQHRLSQVSLERQLEAARLHLSRAQAQQHKLQERLALLTDQLELLTEPDLAAQEELQALILSRDALAAEKLLLEQQLQQLDEQLRQTEQGQHGVQQQLQARQKQMEHLRLDAEGYRVRANNMLELLREQQVSLKELLPTLPADADESLWQQQLEKTQEALGRLGPINLAAIEEFQQQDERKKYLDLQHDDLTAALETLETAIKKIDRETRQKFKATFEAVNEGLQTLFPKVFGGGSAYLALTDEDLLETGVSIMARPPGKKNSTIHLLSGGEKALTALSLVFSIFRLNPAPFCMLDEVDAPLDDANVGRFCNLVREMSDSVQFIYISHNKIAMEMAAQLMGVTMQEPGVSRVVAVDVEDAVKMAQA